MNPNVNLYFNNLKNWQVELEKLREIILDCGLTEELKWRTPCYTFNSNNIVLINHFKEYCCIGFFKGALLEDANNYLVKPGENTQSSMILKFKNIEEIQNLKLIIKAFIFEAIEIEKAGLKIEYKKHTEYEIPEELSIKFEENAAFKSAFEALTPGRQKAYFLHFSSTNQSKTRTSRIEKCIPLILNGFGLNDCTCGLTKRKPNCDGSHKFLVKN